MDENRSILEHGCQEEAMAKRLLWVLPTNSTGVRPGAWAEALPSWWCRHSRGSGAGPWRQALGGEAQAGRSVCTPGPGLPVKGGVSTAPAGTERPRGAALTDQVSPPLSSQWLPHLFLIHGNGFGEGKPLLSTYYVLEVSML